MEPIGLTLKEEGFDKYGNKKQGEVMVIHRCLECGKISINRIAADDDNEKILELLMHTIGSETKKELLNSSIIPLSNPQRRLIQSALFGKSR